MTDPRSPTVRFNEQVTVTECPPNGAVFTFDANPSTSVENVGGIETSSPTQGDDGQNPVALGPARIGIGSIGRPTDV